MKSLLRKAICKVPRNRRWVVVAAICVVGLLATDQTIGDGWPVWLFMVWAVISGLVAALAGEWWENLDKETDA